MTKLTKPVRRETTSSVSGRSLVATLMPGSDTALLSLKQKGRQMAYEEPLDAIFYWMAKRHAEHDRKKREDEQMARRAAR